jgi:holliday junction resolvase Hjr
MGNKEKGAAAERELYHLFCAAGFKCVRVAGSGTMQETACDLIVGKFKNKYSIEVKSCKSKKRYLEPKQIEEFIIFSEIFGLQPFIAVRFNREGWYFLKPQQLEKTPGGLAISLEDAKKKGKRFWDVAEK